MSEREKMISLNDNLCEILFKYERLQSLLNCIQILIAEGRIKIIGLQKNALDYSLYEIESGFYENNKKLGEILDSDIWETIEK